MSINKDHARCLCGSPSLLLAWNPLMMKVLKKGDMPTVKIVNMSELPKEQIQQAAQILTDSLPLGWATLQDALDEINKRLIPQNTLLAGIQDGEVIGWCGILPIYNGNVFELHPLAVREEWRKRGVGTALVQAVEEEARRQSGLTLWLGADDEREGGETSFANVDLYDDLPSRIQTFEPGTHQSAFYLKLGFRIAGVVPDANGVGKPDIYFAKRL